MANFDCHKCKKLYHQYDNGRRRRLLTNKNAYITTTSTEPDIWYIGGARDKAAIAEQIAAAYMAACQTV